VGHAGGGTKGPPVGVQRAFLKGGRLKKNILFQ